MELNQIGICPFCESENVSLVRNNLINQFNVCCYNCAAFGPVKETEFLAIEAWNRAGYFKRHLSEE